MNASEQTDWYDWWFSRGIQKGALGIVLVVAILSLISVTTYVSISDSNVTFEDAAFLLGLSENTTSPADQSDDGSDLTSNIVALSVIIGLLMVVLLLPSLKKIKLGDIELDTESVGPKRFELEPVLARSENPINFISGT